MNGILQLLGCLFSLGFHVGLVCLLLLVELEKEREKKGEDRFERLIKGK